MAVAWRTRAPVHVMSDEEHAAVLKSRLERIKLQCCVCCDEGWLTTEETAPRARRIMHLAACRDWEHATCMACLAREADRVLSAAAARRQRADAVRPEKINLPCMYPYGTTACPDRYRWSTVRAVASADALARFLAPPAARASRLLADGVSAALACPACGALSSVLLPALALGEHTTCARCAATWCTRCARVTPSPCPCPCPCAALPDTEVPTAFSRFFTHADGWPKRKSEVTCDELRIFTDAMCGVATSVMSSVSGRKRQRAADSDGVSPHHSSADSDSASPWHHVSCPDCRAGLFKTSACNDLTHCERHVCNVCSVASFPWEPFLPPSHWDKDGVFGCPQWDYDPHWNAAAKAGGVACGFMCVEGDCCSDGAECAVAEHALGIRAMHAARRAKTLAALAREFGPRLVAS